VSVTVRGTALLATLITEIIAGSSGCGSTGAKAGCTSDNQCGASAACMMGTCLQRGSDRTVAVEILPRSDSVSARTDIASVALGPDLIQIQADDRVVLTGTVHNGAAAHVVVLTPSPIPGQADLQFETDLADFNFQLGVGASLLQSRATVWLLPKTQTPGQPPVPFLTTLDTVLNFTFPASAEMTVVRAILHDSLELPASGYMARAYVGTSVVSNAATTDELGLFTLLIAPKTLANDKQTMITVELTPPAAQDSGPRFVTQPFPVVAGTVNSVLPRTFRMPAFLTPAPLRFTVQSPNRNAQPVSDATVRFRTDIPTAWAASDGMAASDGTAIYEREARTNGLGEVEVLLIPGTATDPRNYQITIQPPPDSGYAARCVPLHPVTIAGNQGQPQYSTTFTLDPQFTLQGNILGSDGLPAVAVTVTATPTAADPGCVNAISKAPISSTTLRNGSYQMLVDPGTYRLDIDPPIGAPLPRLTEEAERAITIANNTTHDVMLPAGEVVDGTVVGANGMPLGSAGIRILQVLCQEESCIGASRIPPALRSQTRTDTDGRFRAVLPPP
jgi:hypothetical protein